MMHDLLQVVLLAIAGAAGGMPKIFRQPTLPVAAYIPDYTSAQISRSTGIPSAQQPPADNNDSLHISPKAEYHPGCNEGEVRHVDGSCVIPKIRRNIFVFEAPQQQRYKSPPPILPPPKVLKNHVFIRLNPRPGSHPIVIPPPKQNTIIYVLNKKRRQNQSVIEVATPPPLDPEVYFINYKDGENPLLPDGKKLLSVLESVDSVEALDISDKGKASGSVQYGNEDNVGSDGNDGNYVSGNFK